MTRGASRRAAGIVRLVVVAGALLLTVGGPASVRAADSSAQIVDKPRPPANWGYTPKTIRVAPGSWVTWSNSGTDEHTVTATDGSFDSGILEPSDGYSYYFDQPGTYEYYCGLHAWMTGTVVVGNAVQSSPSSAATSDPGADPASDDTGSDIAFS